LTGGRFVPVLALDDLPVGAQTTAQIAAVKVLLCRTPESIHAVGWLCPHSFQPLLGGQVVNGVIRCPKHGACFELATGKPTNGVTTNALATYQTRVVAGTIEVAV
jgi:nitrite reductase/ring-hydroxylating ferredoxin subunit